MKPTKKAETMTSFVVTVKWGKETFELPLDTSAAVSAFKQTVFERTGVPHDKQKRACGITPMQYK